MAIRGPAITNPLTSISAADVPTKGAPSQTCGSLFDFLKSRSGIDFPDLDKYPITNYRIRYKEKKDKTKGLIMCKRLKIRHAEEDDLAAYNSKKLGPRAEFKGRFMCVNGQWDADWHRNGDGWDIPACPDREQAGAWAAHVEEEAAENEFNDEQDPPQTELATEEPQTDTNCHQLAQNLATESGQSTITACEKCCYDKWMHNPLDEDFLLINLCYDSCEDFTNVVTTDSEIGESTSSQEAGHQENQQTVNVDNIESEAIEEIPPDYCDITYSCVLFDGACDSSACRMCCFNSHQDNLISRDGCYQKCNSMAIAFNQSYNDTLENTNITPTDNDNSSNPITSTNVMHEQTCKETYSCSPGQQDCDPLTCNFCCFQRYAGELTKLDLCYAECNA